MKTFKLTGHALDWAVQEALLKTLHQLELGLLVHRIGYGKKVAKYSTEWSQGGPIIEQEKIAVTPHYSEEWCAYYEFGQIPGDFKGSYGSTPLIAAMRCYVVSKLGDDVDVPEDLL